MTEAEAQRRLRTLLEQMRVRTAALIRAVVRAEEAARDDVARDVPRGTSRGTITQPEAGTLSAYLTLAFAEIRQRVSTALMGAMRRTVVTAANEWVAAHRALYRAIGRTAPPATMATMLQAPDRILLPRFGGIVRQAPAVLLDTNLALSRQHLQRYLTLATGRVPTASVTEVVQRMLQGRLPRGVADAEMLKAVQQAGTLEARLLRVYTTEMWDTTRATQGDLAAESGVVYLVKWMLSVRHTERDICDVLATQNIGWGPGWYPPAEVPDYPHPRCACYLGDVRVLPPKAW